jgi:predicted deacylase
MRLLFVALATVALQARDPFTMAGRSIAPGQRLDFDLAIPAGAADPATYIPVTVLHGAEPGPVLALTAGIHGYEYPPILALQRLLKGTNPGRLRGTLIAVRLAHVSAFESRTPFVNPFDRKNLNRVFPGRAEGTQSERIAHAISQEVIARCDRHVDLHADDGAEWLDAFGGIYGGKLAAAQYEASKEMGVAFGFRNVVTYAVDTRQQLDSGRSCNRQAVAMGKPTVLVEIGENGRADEAWVASLASGLENLLRVLKMMPQAPTPPRADLRWFSGTSGAASRHTGFFAPVSVSGRFVKKGDPIGSVTSYAGEALETITSPVDGYLLYGLTGPAVREGETVVTIALPAPAPLR